MGIQSQSGQIGFKKQVSEATYATPGTGGVFMRTRSGALAGNRELIIPDSEIGGSRDIPDAFLGPIAFSGEYEFYGRMESLATLLYGCMGSVSSVVTGTTPGVDQVGTHTITPVEGALPWYSVEEAIGGGFEVFNYTDAKFNSISLECAPDGYLMGSVGLLAKTQTSGNTKTADITTLLDNTPLMVGTNMTVSIGGVSTLITRSFTMDFTNNIEDDVFQLGSIALADMTEKRRELTMGFTIRPTDAILWKEAMYGSAGATEALAGASVKKAVVVHIETYATVGTGTATTFSLDINVPVATITPFEVSPSGDDVIEFDIELQAMRPSLATPLATFEVVNGETTVV